MLLAAVSHASACWVDPASRQVRTDGRLPEPVGSAVMADAVTADDENRDADAALLYATAALEGNVAATLRLIFFYSRGVGVEQDVEQVYRWRLHARSLGVDPGACGIPSSGSARLGYALKHRETDADDVLAEGVAAQRAGRLKDAIDLYEAAGRKGNGLAAALASTLYLGPLSDRFKAHEWEQAARKLGVGWNIHGGLRCRLPD
jgi:TPR repeat protein